MQALNKLTRWLVVVCMLGAAMPSLATRYQDWWWDPATSGQGVNIGQQGEIIFAAWFTYDASGDSMWVTMSGTLQNNVLTGDLLLFTGPKLGNPYDPTKVTNAKLGTATLTFTGLSKGKLEWTVFGATAGSNIRGLMNLERFTWAPLVYAGTYYTQVVGGSDCADATRSYAVSTTSVVAYDGTTVRITDNMDGGARCEYVGTVAGEGSIMRATGTYTCNTAAESGTWSSSMRFIPSGTQTAISRTDNLTRTRGVCQAVQTVAGAVALR
jgi:hypothetical protein